jgi:hypothetical protein
MRSIKLYSVNFLGYTFVFISIYSFIFIFLYILSIVLFNLNKPQSLWPLKNFQRDYYYDGVRAIWQADPDCAIADDALIYKPREGKCEFNNLEFHTALNFDLYGRSVPDRMKADLSQNGIAFLGDSHTMGWGVNDKDTFVNVLQKYTQKPIFNLAVSSYATERELRRLILSGLIKRIDTIVIQYCDNDLNENIDSVSENKNFKNLEKFKNIRENFLSNDKQNFAYVIRKVLFALKTPIVSLKSFIYPDNPSNFEEHRYYFSQILAKYEKELFGKNIFVFYINSNGSKFLNFSIDKETEFIYMKYSEPEFKREHFYLIDDHLNIDGHEYIAQWLRKVLADVI